MSVSRRDAHGRQLTSLSQLTTALSFLSDRPPRRLLRSRAPRPTRPNLSLRPSQPRSWRTRDPAGDSFRPRLPPRHHRHLRFCPQLLRDLRRSTVWDPGRRREVLPARDAQDAVDEGDGHVQVDCPGAQTRPGGDADPGHIRGDSDDTEEGGDEPTVEVQVGGAEPWVPTLMVVARMTGTVVDETFR